MSGRDHGLSNINKCGLSKVLLFSFAVLLQSFMSICSKVIMSMSSSRDNYDGEGTLPKPMLLTFCRFASTSFALVMHVLVVYFGIPFPGYNHLIATTNNSDNAAGQNVMTDSSRVGDNVSIISGIGKIHRIRHSEESNDTSDTSYVLIDESDSLSAVTASLFPLGDAANEIKILGQPLSMYFIIAIPTFLDIGATALSVAGLFYLDVSFYQMISNSNIVFVALIKHHVLKNYLHKFQWVGIFWIVVSVFIGGSSALLVSGMSSNVTADDGSVSVTDTLIGVFLVIAGTILYAILFVFEEKLMKLDVPVPPLLLIGIEGLWGVVFIIFVMIPVG